MSKRLDQYLVDTGHAPSRARAQEMIRAGHVTLNGAITRKPALKTDSTATIAITAPDIIWVSRAAHKLVAALDHDGFSPAGHIALDIGASTGGFTEVLLKNEATHVFAIDVGQNQLHPSLRNQPRISYVEKCNARTLNTQSITHPNWPHFTIITVDVSFISLTLALPKALDMAPPGCRLFALIKPQFELSPDAIGKGGLVKTRALQEQARDKITAFLTQKNWRIDTLHDSPILGGDGNREYITSATKMEPDL